MLRRKKHEHNLHAKQKNAGRNKIAITCYDWLIPRLLSSFVNGHKGAYYRNVDGGDVNENGEKATG